MTPTRKTNTKKSGRDSAPRVPLHSDQKKGFVWFRGFMRWDKENQDMSQDIRKKTKNKNYVKQALNAPGACECICHQFMFGYPQ